MNTSIHVTLGEVAATLVLVALAVAVSFWRKADLEKDIGIAVVRSAIQLTAIGYVIKFIFDQDNLWFVFLLIATMVVFGALHRAAAGEAGAARVLAAAGRARDRGRDDPGPRGRAGHLQGPSPDIWFRSAAW